MCCYATPAGSKAGTELFIGFEQAGRKVGQHLFGFTSLSFSQKFASFLRQVPEAPPAVAYQVRHGAASHAAAIDGWDMAAIQERLRHAHPGSTLRYKKHIQYLRLLDQVPIEVSSFANDVEQQLGEILSGRGLMPAAPWQAQAMRKRG